nr:alpha/beta hydrolase [Solimonas marina]
MCIVALILFPITNANAREQKAYGAELQAFSYPYPVQHYTFMSQRQQLSMAYMDIAADKPNGRTAVLLHGKNFCGATWVTTIAALHAAGYRVIAPDQIGFCKSSKPASYQFSFEQLAANTHALLGQLGVEHVVLVGHSMGGMLAVRYALMYPQQLDALALVNPIGLEDWRQKGVPWRSVDEWYAKTLQTSFDGIKRYQQSTYYAGHWKPEYDRWVDMLAGMYEGDARKTMAWDQALTYDMIMSQPVIHDIGAIRTPTLLLIGELDNTAVGKDLAPPSLARTLGNYPVLAREAAARIPHATLVPFPDCGHAPQIQQPQRFNETLIARLPTLLATD